MKLHASTAVLALLASTSLVVAQAPKSSGSPSQPSSPQQSAPAITSPAPGATTTSPTQSPGSQGSLAQSSLATANQSEADLDRKIAQIKSQLQLNDSQQSHWTAAESAIKDMLRIHERATMRTGDMSGPLTDRIEQMRRMGQMMSERGAAMTRLADAAKPLYDSLSEDQRRRLHGAVHDAMMQEHGRMGGMMNHDRDDRSYGRGYGNRDSRYGSRYRDYDDYRDGWDRNRSWDSNPYEDRSWDQRRWDRGYSDQYGRGNRNYDQRGFNSGRGQYDYGRGDMNPYGRNYNYNYNSPNGQNDHDDDDHHD